MLMMVLDGTFFITYEKRGERLLGLIPQKLEKQVTSTRYISAY